MTWTSEPDFNDAEGREIVSNGLLIATVYDATDAALIAAAPDLLAALRAVTDCLLGFHASDDFGPSDTEALNAAIAAIAKAQA